MGKGEDTGLRRDELGREQGNAGSGQGGCAPLPSPLSARTSPRYRTPARCRPPSLPAPAAFSNFQLALVPLLCPVHSPRPGGRRRAWLERRLRPGHHRLPRGHSDKAGTVPVRAMWPRGAAATAQPKPCWSKAVPGAGLTPEGDRRCCREEMDTAAPKLHRGQRALPRTLLAPKDCWTVG